MRYKIEGVNTLVRSENSAKPACAGSRYVKDWIMAHPHVDCAIDYGCGKLRYTLELSKRAKNVIAVDSTVQLERVQAIHGIRNTSVVGFIKKRGLRITPVSADVFPRLEVQAGLVVCTNVLSAIPFHSDRAFVIQQIARSLSKSGRTFISVQHRNSDFNRVRREGKARPYGDGYLIENGAWHSFYGLLSKEYLVQLVSDNCLQVERVWLNGQSTYIVASTR